MESSRKILPTLVNLWILLTWSTLNLSVLYNRTTCSRKLFKITTSLSILTHTYIYTLKKTCFNVLKITASYYLTILSRIDLKIKYIFQLVEEKLSNYRDENIYLRDNSTWSNTSSVKWPQFDENNPSFPRWTELWSWYFQEPRLFNSSREQKQSVRLNYALLSPLLCVWFR